MRRSIFFAVVAVATVAMFAASPAATASSDSSAGADRSAAAEHERIVSYWTPERRASAVPRDIQLPAAKPDNPGNGNGNGNGGGGGDDTGSTTVTGAPWTAKDDATAITGKVYFTLDGNRYVCSGGAVESGHDSLVVSAGHCVHGGNGGAFATNWIFYPRYDNGPDPVLGAWTATRLHTTPLWADTFYGFDDDAGFATVYSTTHASLETAITGVGAAVPTVGFSMDHTTVDYFAFGYPAAKKYKGQTLTYCAGPVTDQYDSKKTIAMACDMTGGSSGGPWLRDYGNNARVVNSVNSYGYSSLKDVMFGPIFDGPESDAYGHASAGTCGTNVRCSAPAT